MKKLTKSSGFTLLELVVVIAILAFVITGMMSLFIQAAALSEISGNKTIAVSEIYTKIEEIRNHDFNLIATDYAAGGTPGNSFSTVNGMGMIFVSDYNGSPDILEIKIVVSWKNDNGRVIGEDANLNGVFELSEDVDLDNEYDSPAMLISYISRRS